MMNIKLKKFSIIKPKIKIKTEFYTISRGGTSGGYNNYAVNARTINNSAGIYVFGDAEPLEV